MGMVLNRQGALSGSITTVFFSMTWPPRLSFTVTAAT